MSSHTKIWIAGASGRLGTALTRMLDCMEYDILTSDLDVPVGDLNAVCRFADMNHPNVIINCAGLTDLARCDAEPEQAFLVNAIGARNLAIAARRIGAKIIQISTDDVYAGETARPLSEFDTATPATVYGRSKFAGEGFVRELAPTHVIVRSSWIYGAGTYDFVDKVLESVANGQKFDVPVDEISAPTSADALAGFIKRLIDTSEYGLFHASCEGSCTRADFARAILQRTGNDPALVNAVTGSADGRPHHTMLDNMMMRITGVYKMPDWVDALDTYLAGKER